MSGTSRRVRPVLVAVLAVVALFAAACGSSSSSSTPATSAPSAKVTSTATCKGAPIVIGQIATVTGQSTSFADVPVATEVAVHAVNVTCTDGRPFKLVTCDDQGDANTATTCARTLVADKVVAMVGNTSTVLDQAMAITQAAGIPSLFNDGDSSWESTNPLSYTLANAVVQAFAPVTAALGSGSKTLGVLSSDVPIAGEVVGLLTALGKPLGVKVIPILFPPDTTDFAPVAAQVIASGAKAIICTASGTQAEPLYKALSQQGLASKTILMAPSGLFTPADIKALGPAVQGLYLSAPATPPVGTTEQNAGITEMRKEYVADGQNPDNPDMTALATLAWSGVHVLAQALKGKTTITPATVNAALKALGPVTEPQLPTFDLSTNALGSIPAFKAFRVLTNQIAWYKVNNGELDPVSKGFVPLNEPFDLLKPAS